MERLQEKRNGKIKGNTIKKDKIGNEEYLGKDLINNEISTEPLLFFYVWVHTQKNKTCIIFYIK